MERQSLLKEIGDDQNLQYLIDKSLDRFRPIIWPSLFEWRNVTSIDYKTVIGDSTIGAAASVVSYDSAAPLRTRRHIRELTGEIPSIRQKFQMTERDLQEYLRMVSGASPDAKAILDMIFDDVKACAEAPHKRLDKMVLEAISTGEITLSTTTNPDGIVTASAIDFGMASANKVGCTASWATGGTTSKPITDVLAMVSAAEAVGIKLEKMYMTRATFNRFRAATETVNYVTSYLTVGKVNSGKAQLSKEGINAWLESEGLPQIHIVEASIGVEKDGVITASNPFHATNVLFTPAGKMGKMLNAPIIERLKPAKHVTYAEANKVLIKKWSTVDPIGEFTACELNAFPSWNNVDKCYLLDSINTTFGG